MSQLPSLEIFVEDKSDKNLLMKLTTQIRQLELSRNLSSPWFSLGFVGCMEMYVENRSDYKLVDAVGNPVSPT